MGIVTASEIGGKTVILTTSINSDGNSGIEDCGFVLSTDPSPTIDNNIVKISDLTVTDFSVTVSDLMPLTKYYARAYAINTKVFHIARSWSLRLPIILMKEVLILGTKL